METTLLTLQFLLIPALSPMCIGIIRKIKAHMQNRQGARITQPYLDLWKLLHKDEVISTHASWVFRFVPYALFAISLVIAAGIPVIATRVAVAPVGDFLVIAYFVALSSFLLALAGMDAASAFGGFASSREMTVAALAEGGLILSLFVSAFLAGTTNVGEIVSSLSEITLAGWLPLGIAFVAFFIALLAEAARYPFDNPATHLELTMIHEAMILEYSGKRLALIEWAAANKMLIFVSLAVNIFFPWGLALGADGGAVLIALAVYLLKVLAVLCVIAMLESTIAKLRFFRLPDLLFTSFVLGIIAIGITIITV